MASSRAARFVFGASSVLFGVVQLISHDSELWQALHSIAPLLAAAVAWCVAIVLIAGGSGMLLSRTARSASIVLAAVYLLYALTSVPGMLVTPTDAVLYVNFFEMFSLVCGASAVYAATATLARAARIGLGICAASFAWAQIVYFQYTASLVPTWIPPSQAFWTILTTAAFTLAAIAILINRQARLAALLMTLMIGLFGILVWVPRIISQPQSLSNWNEIATNYLMAGAAWLVADFCLTNPRPGS
jgi:hypothetical protein